MRQRLKNQLLNTDGSSMISVLVAFIILLIGIAGFARAVGTANEMVRRAETLNTATGKVLEEYFYPEYASTPTGESYPAPIIVYEDDGSSGAGTSAFKLHGRLRLREYTVNITPSGSGTSEPEDSESLTYSMYFYK